MSILDGLPSSPLEATGALALVAPMLEQVLNELALSPKEQSVLELLRKGLSLGDICGVTEQERDALFLQGYRLIQIGQIAKARDTFLTLFQLEPLDARVLYALASTFQLEGDVSKAAKLYIYFLALDATNPEGYLRLGECFLAAKEYDNAYNCFHFVQKSKAVCNTSDKAVAYAVKMMDEVKTRRNQKTAARPRVNKKER